MIKKIFSHTLIYALGPQLPKIAGIFVLPFITRYLTPLDYGVSGLIMAYTGLLGALKDMGLGVVQANIFFKYPSKWKIIWRQLHGYLSLWAIIFALLQAILIYLVFPNEAIANRLNVVLLYTFSAVFFEVTIMVGSRFYQYSQKPVYISVVSATVGTITIILNYITIVSFKLGYMGWFLSTFIGNFITFVFYVYPVYFKYRIRPIFLLKKRFITKHLKVSLPTIPHNYSSYLLNTSDRIVINALGINISKLGLYNLAYTFGNYFEIIGNAAGMAVGPLYLKLLAKNSIKAHKEARMLTYFMQVLFFIGTFIICLWCKEILHILIRNKELQQAYILAIVIIMGYNYRPMYWATINILCFSEKTDKLWRITLIGGLLNVVLNFIFIPIFGYTAAAYTTFACLMYIGFAGFFLKSYKVLKQINYYPIFWLLLNIILTLILLLIKDVAALYKVVLSILLILGSAILLKQYFKRLNSIEV